SRPNAARASSKSASTHGRVSLGPQAIHPKGEYQEASDTVSPATMSANVSEIGRSLIRARGGTSSAAKSTVADAQKMRMPPLGATYRPIDVFGMRASGVVNRAR